MQEPKPSRSVRLRVQTDRAKNLVKKIAPIGIGVLVTLLALVLFNVINPPAQPLTQKQLDQRIAQVMASATAPPANSARVSFKRLRRP